MHVHGISGIGRASGPAPVQASTWSGASRRAGGPGAVGRMQAAVASASQLLNLSPGDLINQLGGGQSLTSVAAARGVSRSSLLATLTTAVSTAVPQGSAPLTGDALRTVVDRIATSTAVPAGFTLPGAG